MLCRGEAATEVALHVQSVLPQSLLRKRLQMDMYRQYWKLCSFLTLPEEGLPSA